MSEAPRRIVTGLDPEGKSCVLFDGPAEGMVIWVTDASPVDNSGTADTGGGPFNLSLPAGGSMVTHVTFPPHGRYELHATDTIDYIVVLSGELVLGTETGETIVRAGDVVIDRGILHSWRNERDEPCRTILVVLPAHPVGAGATMTGVIEG